MKKFTRLMQAPLALLLLAMLVSACSGGGGSGSGSASGTAQISPVTPIAPPNPPPTIPPPVNTTPPPANGTYHTLYVAITGNDANGNTCLDKLSPCRTIARGIAGMTGGDTLIIGDGTYAEPITSMPSGFTGVYTTIQAEHDWMVTIDGSGFQNYYKDGITIQSKSWVTVRGFHVIMNQKKTLNSAVNVPYSDHIRVQRVSAGYGGSDDADPNIATGANVANIGAGPASSYVLFEESFAYGGGRYNFIAYQSDHIVFRRNVSRIDHWNGSIQCAGFANYNAVDTLWQNNIVIDSDGAGCYAQGYGKDTNPPLGTGRLFAGFFNENKAPDPSWFGNSTRETFRGNIVLNVQPLYAAMYDYDMSDVHTYSDNIIWDSRGGLYGDYIPVTPDDVAFCNANGIAPCRVPATLNASNMTIGAITGAYGDPASGTGAFGTGYSVSSAAIFNSIAKSVLWKNPSYGMADHAAGNNNSYFGNGNNRGGNYKLPAPGANDRTETTISANASLQFLPRMEAGSPLALAGIGADVRFMQGATGTLWGETGYDTKQSTCLWPFPNEAVIKEKMGAYVKQADTTVPGPIGARGFAAAGAKSKDNSPQSLTKYIWEYLGNAIPNGNLCQ